MNKPFNGKIPGLAQLVPILAILMEVFYSYAWLVWFSSISSLGWAHPPLNLVSCLVLAVFCEVMARFSLARNWSLRRVRLVVLSSSLVLLLLLLRLNLGGGYSLFDSEWVKYASKHIVELVIGLVFGIYLVWRGLSVGGTLNSFRVVYNRFLIGLGVLILLLIIWGLTGGQVREIGSSAGLYTILFFGTGLLAMATANLEALRAELLQHQEAATAFNRRWIALLLVLVLAILGIGIAFASIFSSDMAATIGQALGTFGDWLLTALIYLLYPLAFIASGFYYLFRWLLSLVRREQTPQEMEGMGMQDWKDIVQGQSGVQVPEAVLLALKWIMILLVVSLVIYFLARILVRRSRRKVQDEVEEVNENFWSWGLFSSDLRALLTWLFRWLHKKKSAAPGNAAAIFNVPYIEEETGRIYSIRELYRAWLWQAGQRWSPRHKSETAFEYRSRLGTNVDRIAEELDPLTEAYIQARYGEEKAGDERLKGLNRLWHALRDKLNRPDPAE